MMPILKKVEGGFSPWFGKGCFVFCEGGFVVLWCNEYRAGIDLDGLGEG